MSSFSSFFHVASLCFGVEQTDGDQAEYHDDSINHKGIACTQMFYLDREQGGDGETDNSIEDTCKRYTQSFYMIREYLRQQYPGNRT